MDASLIRLSVTESTWRPAPRAQVLIVGFGNTLRGDDGAGPAVVARLALRVPRRLVEQGRVRLITRHQLVPELCLDLSECASAIFIDAATDLRPGQVHCAAVRRAPDFGAGTGLHTLTPAGLLAMTQAMCGAVPEAQLWSIGAADFAFGENLSAPVEAAVADVVDHLVARIVSQVEVRSTMAANGMKLEVSRA